MENIERIYTEVGSGIQSVLPVPIPAIVFSGQNLSVRFDRFNIAAYDLFLRVKRLPEFKLDFDRDAEAYTITAPARFAPVLGVAVPEHIRKPIDLSPFLFDDQREIVQMALDGKRFACWSDCGLGKTIIGLEFARHVCHMTGGRVLIVTLNEIVPQWIEEAGKFYGDALPVVRLSSRGEMKEWCEHGTIGGVPTAAAIAVTNYEKFNHPTEADQVVNEIRHLAGIVIDESSRLKTGGGQQKWAIIKSSKGLQYKLSLTATPAPNEIMEFASQASFLEKMRTQEEIIWTYFRRDEKTHRWTVRPHARAAFFEFMSSWSIYVRDPRRYGWRLNVPRPPEPERFIHVIEATPEQRQFVAEFNFSVKPKADRSGTASMFAETYNAIQSTKLSQAAKGFVYVKRGDPAGVRGLSGKLQRAMPSLKPAFVAGLVAKDIAAGLQILVWCEYDEEIAIVAQILKLSQPSLKFEVLTGSVKKKDRQSIKSRFVCGETAVLITRADLMGYGQNLQNCGSMILSGWSFSYEDYYQAIRRAFRHGQTRSVRIHIPVIQELEGQMFDALGRKEQQHEAAIAEMEGNYIRARAQIRGAA